MPEMFIVIKAKLSPLAAFFANASHPLAKLKTYAIRIVRFSTFGFIAIFISMSLFILLIIAPINLMQRFITFSKLMRFDYQSPAPLSAEPHDFLNMVNEELKTSRKKLAAYTPTKPYLLINTTTNNFELHQGQELVRSGRCSTGSYVKLQGKDQEWIFKTPKGYQTIKGKATNPVWKKPDWAFVEEGLLVPSPNHHTRFENGVLGSYALYLGDGYMIHGTLYQRLLGLPVTHGCIRLGDEDLEAVYKTLSPNSKVFIL